MRDLKRQQRAGAWLFAAVLTVLAAGCGREPGSTNVTRGSLTLECDEAVEPVMRVQADEFA